MADCEGIIFFSGKPVPHSAGRHPKGLAAVHRAVNLMSKLDFLIKDAGADANIKVSKVARDVT